MDAKMAIPSKIMQSPQRLKEESERLHSIEDELTQLREHRKAQNMQWDSEEADLVAIKESIEASMQVLDRSIGDEDMGHARIARGYEDAGEDTRAGHA